MQPTVTRISERNTLGQNNVITKALVIEYMVGTHGPFTLVTNQQDLNNGAAKAQMVAFAQTLASLPGISA
jgi:ribosomal protein S8E